MIILPNKSKPPEHSNKTPASSAWAPTPATKSLAIFGVRSLLLEVLSYRVYIKFGEKSIT